MKPRSFSRVKKMINKVKRQHIEWGGGCFHSIYPKGLISRMCKGRWRNSTKANHWVKKWTMRPTNSSRILLTPTRVWRELPSHFLSGWDATNEEHLSCSFPSRQEGRQLLKIPRPFQKPLVSLPLSFKKNPISRFFSGRCFSLPLYFYVHLVTLHIQFLCLQLIPSFSFHTKLRKKTHWKFLITKEMSNLFSKEEIQVVSDILKKKQCSRHQPSGKCKLKLQGYHFSLVIKDSIWESDVTNAER